MLIDRKTLIDGCCHDHSIIDAGLGHFGLPIETVRRWACLGAITPVVVAADGVRLYLGRETRLANRAQRRALRLLHRTCALCDVPFEHPSPPRHLVRAPARVDRHRQPVPLCSKNHRAHEGGWQLHLAADRTLTLTQPGGRTTISGPPHIQAA